VTAEATATDGVTLRPWRRADLSAMADVINARITAEGDGEHVTEASIAEQYDHLQRCDPLTDIVVAESADGTVVGYARTAWSDVRDGHREFWIVNEARDDVPEAHQLLFDWTVARATALATEHDHPRKRLRAFAAVGGRRHELLTAAGFEPIGYSANMVRTGLHEVAECPLPSGVVVRPVVDDHLRVIWEADVEAFRDHPGFVEPDEDDWGRFLDEAAAADTNLWKVAWDGDAVVGQVRTRVQEGEAERIGRRRAWTEEISTRKDWRRRGVASALITSSLRQLAALGFDEAALSADIDSDTGSFRLYESLGYREVLRSAMLTRPL
jgi:ribosomal protein S18 acetylase RimI-like enzyme